MSNHKDIKAKPLRFGCGRKLINSMAMRCHCLFQINLEQRKPDNLSICQFGLDSNIQNSHNGICKFKKNNIQIIPILVIVAAIKLYILLPLCTI